jgi:hypothetical protein
MAAAVGAEAAEQFNGLEQVGLAFAVVAHHQQPSTPDRQRQGPVVAEALEVEVSELDGG